MTGARFGAVSGWRSWGLGLIVLLAACQQAPPPAAPREHWVPARHLVDDLAELAGVREGPWVTIGSATHYVLAELPTRPLEVLNAPVTATSDDTVELSLTCPPEFAGLPVELNVSGFPTLPGPIPPTAVRDTIQGLANLTLQIPPSLTCPTDATEPVAVPLRGLTAGMTLTPTVVATAEPVARVEMTWFAPGDGAVLRLSLGLADPALSGSTAGARFIIRAENRTAQSVSVLDRVLDPAQRPSEMGWVDESIPMASATAALGPEFRLIFETEPASDQRPAFPVWGDPTIFVPAATTTPARRNLVLVSIDTLRADRLGIGGAFPTNSPGLDRLAQDGTFFTAAFAAAPWTLPSHTTMLTGVLGCVHGRGVRWDPLGAGISPVAEILRRNGYSTAAFTEDVYLTPTAFQRGFGVFEAFTSLTTTSGARTDVERTVGHARAWVEQHANEPFFLFVHTYQVHAPYQAPPPFGDLLGGRLDDDLVSRPRQVQARQDLIRYDEEVRYTDSVLGSLIATVDRLGLTDSTIVVVTADHGEAFGEHGWFGHSRTMDEEVLHVPLIWHAPGLIAAGRRSSVVAGLADIVPTILDLLGLPIPSLIGGGSLAAFLRDVDPPVVPARTRVVISESMLGKIFPVVVRGPHWRAKFAGPAVTVPELLVVANGRETAIPPTGGIAEQAIAARSRYDADCQRLTPLAKQDATPLPSRVPTADEVRALRALGYLQ